MPGYLSFGSVSAAAALSASLLLCAPTRASAQVFVVQPEHIEQHYTTFDPTHVQLSTARLTTVGREQLIRFLQSEQGFAMRPLPVGVLELKANGGMEPGGEKYIDELHSKGVCAKPGDRVVITNLTIEKDRIVFDLNGGPFHKHRFMRHISVGMGGVETPLGNDLDPSPSGSRVTLIFSGRIPDISGEQVEQLLKPMIDFGVKSPAEAYAESLPPFLQKAILQHRVLIGMDRDMVRYAKGEPSRKIRESENGQPFEIWVYGEAPQPVEFVRFVGSFVVRDELARVGEPMVVHTDNEMGDFWGNKPVVAANQHQVQLGDRTSQDAAEENAPRSAPTLRQPGEKLPTDNAKDQPVMKPVNFPPGMQRPGDPGYSPTVSAKQPAGTAPTSGSTQASGSTQPAAASNSQTQSCPSSDKDAATKPPANCGKAGAPQNQQQPAPSPATTSSQKLVASSH